MSLLEMRDISKEFPGVRALQGVSIVAERGEVLALLGENGAGKSTLMKILSGVYPYPDYGGEIRIDGRPCQFRSTRDAVDAGVTIIHQELNLVPQFTVAENIFLGREPVRRGIVDDQAMERDAAAILHKMHVDLEPRTPVSQLSVGQQQLVEIAKALSLRTRILVMDEPTSALAQSEVLHLFELVRKLQQDGVIILYISHKLDEIFALADRVTVLRDGQYVGTRRTADVTRDELVSMMVGRELGELYPKAQADKGDVVLKVEGLSAQRPDLPGTWAVADVSFELRAGEVLGVGGLMGAGRTELALALFGAWPGQRQGQVHMAGRKALPRSPREAIEAGLALVTEDRKLTGLVLGMETGENISLAYLQRLSPLGVVDRQAEGALVSRFIRELKVKVAGPQQVVGTLSGGNQQKVVLAKWLATAPRVLILDEPTRGIDVGAKAEVYQIIGELASQGVAILMISSELPELLAMGDRILVMHQGRAAGILDRTEATQERIMAYATGGM
ncbi:MAG: sugar ABC transporter ATP-binding protein [Symbiobacteriia bacterium]